MLPIHRTLLSVFLVLGLALAFLPGCETTKDLVTVTTDLQEIDAEWQRADALVQAHAENLEPEARDQLLSAWLELSEIRDYLTSVNVESLARHPQEVVPLYWQGRAAYSQVREAVAGYIDALHEPSILIR